MKFLIILSVIFMIPIVMKFQTRTILTESNPETLQVLVAILKKHEVVGPEVTLEYLDVSVGGLVSSEQKAREVAAEVEAVRGVRLASNELFVEGWLEMTNQGESLQVRGLFPREWAAEALKKFPNADLSEARTLDSVRIAGRSSASWGLLIDQFFEGDGDRTLSLRNGQLDLSGEIIPSEEAKIPELVAPLGNSIAVRTNFTVRASPFHFRSRVVESQIEGEPLRSLQQRLANSLIDFSDKSTSLTEAGRTRLTELSALLVQTDSRVSFLLGAYPDEDGADLAASRAEVVAKELVALGVDRARLQVQPFEATGDSSDYRGKVELLVR